MKQSSGDAQRVAVLVFGCKNLNGRTYTIDQTSFRPTGLLVAEPQDNFDINSDTVIGSYSDMRIIDQKLTCLIKLLDTPKCKSLDIDASTKWIALGYGDIDENGYVKNYSFGTAYPEPFSAWSLL